jgi:hypothetical protein
MITDLTKNNQMVVFVNNIKTVPREFIDEQISLFRKKFDEKLGSLLVIKRNCPIPFSPSIPSIEIREGYFGDTICVVVNFSKNDSKFKNRVIKAEDKFLASYNCLANSKNQYIEKTKHYKESESYLFSSEE